MNDYNDVIEGIDDLLEIFDQFTDNEFTDNEYDEEEEAQRMSIETINLTQQIINGEIELEPINLTYQFINKQIINSYLQNGDKIIETCSICLDDVVNIESISKLSCGHHFHTNCIRLCLERNIKCPLCRQYCLIIN
jgi:hypothetical protein